LQSRHYVTSEVDSESPIALQKTIFKRGVCKRLVVVTCQLREND
jgi:hypothetical protein